MFATLLKHEVKTSARLMVGLTLGVIGLAVLSAVVICASGNSGNLEAFSSFFIMGTMFSIIGYYLASMLLPLGQFYRYKFTDQGYLTFTLPVSTHQLLLSSAVNMILWYLIGTVVTIGSLLLYVASVFYMVQEALDFHQMMDTFYESLASVGMNGTSYVFQFLCGMLSSVSLSMLAVTLGAQIAKKHKVLAAVGMYFGITWVASLASELLLGYGSANYILTSVVNLAIAAGGYFITHHLLDKKLNLT